MQLTISRAALAVSGALALAPTAGLAQTVPDIQDLVVQSEQVNRNADAANRQGEALLPSGDGAVDGEAGVYVLTLNKIFQLNAGAGFGYTDNPTRSNADVGGSFFADFTTGAGVATRIDGVVDFGAGVSLNGREFLKDNGPSSRSLSGTVSAGVPIAGPVYIGVAGFGGFSYDGDFESGVGFYGLSGTLSAAFPLTPRLSVRPGVGAVRQWSEVTENNSTSISGSIDVSYSLTPTVSVLARGGVTVRWYDDFYEDVTFVERRDTTYGGSVTLGWRPTETFFLSANASLDRQDSRLFLSEFSALELGLAVTARYRF